MPRPMPILCSLCMHLYSLWATIIHCESEKLDPFSFEHNFGKYCPILIILSLLRTNLNCDQLYPKIYHHIQNLLVQYLVKWTRIFRPTLLAWFRNYRCNSQTSHTECNRYGQNQQCQFTRIDCSRPHQTSVSCRFNSSTLWICLW